VARRRPCFAAWLLAASWSCNLPAADYYVHASMGSDTSVGSSSAPFRTLARLQATMDAGDRAFLAGTFRESLYLEGLSNITVAQWEGEAQAVLRGDRVITGAWSGGAGVWSTTIEPAVTPGAVVVDWDTSVDEHGRHYGFLRAAAGPEEVLNEPNSFWFSDASDTLTVNLAGDDPTEHQIAYSRLGVDGLTIFGAPAGVANVVVDGLHSYLWADPTPGWGYGFKMLDCRDSVLRNHVAIDNGFHGSGWVNYYTPNTNNREENGAVWGCNDDSCYVFYTGVGDITGARLTDCVAYKYTYLGRDARPLGGRGCLGFACHTSADGPLVRDFEMRRCRVVEFDDDNLGAAIGPQNTSYPSDESDWRTYPVRAVECVVEGGKANLFYPSGLAMVRCDLRYTRSGARAASEEAVFADNYAPGPGAILLDSCQVIADLDGPGSRAFFGVRADMRWTILNSSFLDVGVNTREHRAFAWYTPRAGLVARGSVFAFRNRNGVRWLGYGDNDAAWLALHDFDDGVYVNISDHGYSTVWDGSFNNEHEWRSMVDPGGVYTRALPFLDATGASGLELDDRGELWSARRFPTPHSRVGFNGTAFTGTLGAYQHRCDADLNDDGFVNADDYDTFAQAFEDGSPDADVNQDGYVNGDDYDAFAEAFEEGC
jgi:hypothetical protein